MAKRGLFGQIVDWIKYVTGIKENPPPFKEPLEPVPMEPVPPMEPEIPEEFEEEDEEETDVLYTRKYLGTQPYSDNFGKKGEMYFAVTYEDNDFNRENELLQEIMDRFQLTHEPDYGYDDNEQTDNPPFKWDEIRTGMI